MSVNTTSSAPVSVGFVSLGCAKNLVDSQVMAGVLLREGMELAPSPEEADVVVVNTCAFIEDAREESLENIRSVCNLKREGKCRAVLVAGCLPQRYAESIREQLPDVDAFIGLDQLEDVGAVVGRLMAGDHGVLAVSRESQALYEPAVPGLAFSAGRYAYLKIAEGCNHPCAFCAIPAIRGRHRSRPIDSLLSEATHLLENGFRELDLISQDTTSYGRDLEDGTTLPKLLRALGRIGGDFWIRVLYAYPTGLTNELLDAIAEVPQVCAYLDIPVQHSHPDILRSMLRADTIGRVDAMSGYLRGRLEDVTLRTTCLVGFPGETEAHFKHLLAYITDSEFDHVGVFAFSPEEGTPAMDLPDRPDTDTTEERRMRLLNAQNEVVDGKLDSLLGREAEVLLERREVVDGEAIWIARSRRLAPEVDGVVYVSDVHDDACPGDFVTVTYTEQLDYELAATAAC